MDSQRRRNAETDLKATADDLVADARRVEALEELKETLDPDDPRMKPLADESERVTAEMATKAQMESKLRREADSDPSN